jgi:hypothetical protein
MISDGLTAGAMAALWKRRPRMVVSDRSGTARVRIPLSANQYRSCRHQVKKNCAYDFCQEGRCANV